MLRDHLVQQQHVALVHEHIVARRRRQVAYEIPIDRFAHLADGAVQIAVLGRQSLQFLLGARQQIGERLQLAVRQAAAFGHCGATERMRWFCLFVGQDGL